MRVALLIGVLSLTCLTTESFGANTLLSGWRDADVIVYGKVIGSTGADIHHGDVIVEVQDVIKGAFTKSALCIERKEVEGEVAAPAIGEMGLFSLRQPHEEKGLTTFKEVLRFVADHGQETVDDFRAELVRAVVETVQLDVSQSAADAAHASPDPVELHASIEVEFDREGKPFNTRNLEASPLQEFNEAVMWSLMRHLPSSISTLGGQRMQFEVHGMLE